MSVNDGRFEEGREIRRAVLGADHVDRSLERASEFGRPLQDLVTEYCWGASAVDPPASSGGVRDGRDRLTRPYRGPL